MPRTFGWKLAYLLFLKRIRGVLFPPMLAYFIMTCDNLFLLLLACVLRRTTPLNHVNHVNLRSLNLFSQNPVEQGNSGTALTLKGIIIRAQRFGATLARRTSKND